MLNIRICYIYCAWFSNRQSRQYNKETTTPNKIKEVLHQNAALERSETSYW